MLTPTQVREHVETGLSDNALQRLIDDAERAIVGHAGPHPPTNVTVTLDGDVRTLVLPRAADEVVTVDETVGTTDTTLEADDFRLRGAFRLERLRNGYRRRWGREVTVTFTPVDDTQAREALLVRLVQLTIEYRGLGSERVGDWQGDHHDYRRERDALLATLDSGPVLV